MGFLFGVGENIIKLGFSCITLNILKSIKTYILYGIIPQ